MEPLTTYKKIKGDLFVICEGIVNSDKLSVMRMQVCYAFTREARKAGFKFMTETLPAIHRAFELDRDHDGISLLQYLARYCEV
jgi:hypothetical protein